jgi:transcriptional regulator with XRE-family HTH domain
MTFSEKIQYLVENLSDGKIISFSRETGISYTTLQEYYHGKKKNPQLSFINKILDRYDNVNALWLIRNEENPFLPVEKPDTAPDVKGINPNLLLRELMKVKKEEIDSLKEFIQSLQQEIIELREDKTQLKNLLKDQISF